MDANVISQIINSEAAKTILTIFIIPVVTVMATYITTYFKAKTNAVEKEQESNTLEKHYKIAYAEIEEAVETVDQTYVADLKAAGEFTEECQMIAKERARVEFKTNCPKSVMETLNKELTDEEFELWIHSKIDSAVSKRKKAKAAKKEG